MPSKNLELERLRAIAVLGVADWIRVDGVSIDDMKDGFETALIS